MWGESDTVMLKIVGTITKNLVPWNLCTPVLVIFYYVAIIIIIIIIIVVISPVRH